MKVFETFDPKSTKFPATDEMARFRGWEAATLSMKNGGRKAFTLEDFNAGTEVYNRLTLWYEKHCPGNVDTLT